MREPRPRVRRRLHAKLSARSCHLGQKVVSSAEVNEGGGSKGEEADATVKRSRDMGAKRREQMSIHSCASVVVWWSYKAASDC